MNIPKLSLTALTVIGLGIGLFLLWNKSPLAPVVKTTKFSPVFDGLSPQAFINGPKAMLAAVARSISPSQGKQIERDTDTLAASLAVTETYRDNDRIF